jgi:hypothetical protein
VSALADNSSVAFAAHAQPAGRAERNTLSTARAYLFSDGRRSVQSVLGLIWLLDGALQFQSFMYGSGFTSMLTGMESGQPHWLSSSVGWGARLAGGHQGFWNTLFALTQVAIGLGLLVRPTVRLALAGSFVWVFIVWWFGEAFGMLFANAAGPLTGAPGAVLLYGMIGLIVWPNDRPGGLIGARGARIAWAALWVLMAWLWLIPANSGANAVSGQIGAAPSGMGWLNTVLAHASIATRSNGFLIALILAAISVTIGIAVAVDWESRTFLWLAIWIGALYWIFGQGFGGLATGTATDVNSGPLWILLACAIFTTLPAERKQVATAPASARRLEGAVG